MRNNAQMLTSTLMPMFVKKHYEVFLAAGLGIVSSFNIGHSILRGHWGKRLEEKTCIIQFSQCNLYRIRLLKEHF